MPPRRAPRKPPPTITAPLLRARAERHLERFWPTEAQLRRVLLRYVDKLLAAQSPDEERSPPPEEGPDPAARRRAAAQVEGVIADLRAVGLLDDRKVAEAWAGNLHRRGLSERSIQERLRQKGLSAPLREGALARVEAEAEAPELARACTYALRRRLGAARAEARRPTERDEARKRREKDVAALCRAGFSLGIALRVVDAADLEALREEALG